jgi:3-oxoacyl-[acyl-carrier-protein] synthase II
MEKGRRVVVTGGGIVSALGSEWPDILSALKAGKNCVRCMKDWNKIQGMNTRLAAPVDFVLPSYPRKKIRGMGRVAQMALVATDQALKTAGLADSPELKAGRCGIAYGSCLGSIDPLVDLYSLLVLNDTSRFNSSTYIKAMPQTCAANLEVFYGLTGRIITANTACTSGSLAIGQSYELIKDGYQDIMLAGGAEELSAADAAIFDTLFAASTKNNNPDKTPRPFDKDRDGLVIGEGAGTVILEEYEHAKKRGAPIFAELVGFGTNTDGTHITNPNRATRAIAMRLALESAGLEPGQIGYVNAHATSTPTGDVIESQATYDVFKRAVPISSLKGYTGHTLGACGSIEAWLSINMMNEGWFFPNINLDNVDENCAPLDYIVGQGREIKTDYVMSNNFAFGGVNTSLIFKRFKA